MKQIARLIPCLLCCLVLTGCSLYCNGTQTLLVKPWLFCTDRDACHTQAKAGKCAAAAWQAHVEANPGDACRKEFERGFRDGFADFLYAGGTGEPPPVPPRRLWNLDYRTPEGHQAVEDWFAGFRCGAAAAREGGCREQMTIRSSLSANKHAGDPAAPVGVTEQVRPIEVLPTPAPTEAVPQLRKPAPPSQEPQPSSEESVLEGLRSACRPR
ncbi:MAG: hypothetical protein ABSG68_08275 [Thermoguttaceae bacterium]|jgi:hypothetical protein